MSRLTLRLPETLNHKLVDVAKSEGVSLNQYIVYALACQVNTNYTVEKISDENIQKQKESFNRLLQNLEKGDDAQIDTVLSEREFVAPEEQLDPQLQELLLQKLQSLKMAS